MWQVIKEYYGNKEEEKMKEEKVRREREEKVRIKEDERKKQMLKKHENKEEIWKQLAVPKDKWKVGKTLLELKKQFPMDEILRKMVKEEFKNNRVFRYPEEYEVYEEEEEVKRKIKKAEVARKLDPNEAANEDQKGKERRKKKIEDLKRATVVDTADEKERREKEINDKRPLEMYLKQAIRGYLKNKDKRLEKQTGTLRNFIGEKYQEMVKWKPEEMGKFFPFPNYDGIDHNKKEEGQSKRRKLYPKEFKALFLETLRTYVPIKKGKYVRLPNKPLPFWIPSSRPCPSNEKGISLGEFTEKSVNAKGKKKKMGPSLEEIEQFCFHAWDRKDELTKTKKGKVMMKLSDIENCTFKPHITPFAKGEEIGKPEEEIDSKVLSYH